MAEKWIYQVKMDEAGTKWKKVGEERSTFQEVFVAAIYASPLLEKYKRRYENAVKNYNNPYPGPLGPFRKFMTEHAEDIVNIIEVIDPDRMSLPSPGDQSEDKINRVDEFMTEWSKEFGEIPEKQERMLEQGDYNSPAAREEQFDWVIQCNYEEIYRKGYIRWAVENPEYELGAAYDERGGTTDWQIKYNEKWVDAYLARPTIAPDGREVPCIVDFLKQHGIKVDPSKVYTEGSRAAEELLEKGLRRGIIRRRIPATSGDVGTITGASDLAALVEAQKPYHELLDNAITGLEHKTYIKILGTIWGVDDTGHLKVSGSGGEIYYAGSIYAISVLQKWLSASGNRNIFVGNTQFIPPPSSRPFAFMSVGELEQLKVDLPEVLERDISILDVMERGWIQVVYQKVLEAIEAELRRKATEQDQFPPDLGWALWRDVVFADKAWEGYENLVNRRTPFLAAGLSDAGLEAIWKYYLDLVPRDKFSSTVLVNDSLLRLGRFVELPPHEGGDMPGRERWGYDYRKDVLEKYIGAILNTNQLPLESPITPELGPSGEYRGFPSIYDQQHPLQSYVPPIGEQQAVASITSVGGGVWGPAALLNLAMYGALPEQETQTELTSTTPAGGDGVVASPAGGASSSSLPSFPSVSLPGLGGGPSALPSPVGLGGVVGGVTSTPSVGLPGLGWDGVAMPAPSIGLSRLGGVSAPAMPAMETVSPIGMPGGPAIPSSVPSTPVSAQAQGGPSGGGGGFDFANLLGGSRQSMIAGSQGFAGTETPEAGQSLSRAEKLVERLMQIPDMLAMAEPQSLGSLGSSGKSVGDVSQRIQPQQLVRMVINRHEEISKEKLEQYVLAWLQSHSRVG